MNRNDRTRPLATLHLTCYCSAMEDRLHTLMARADANLDAPARAVLADIVEGFIATHAGAPDFTDDERAHLRRIDGEPFVAADREAVAALFARRG